MPTAKRLKGQTVADPSQRIFREGKEIRNNLHKLEYQNRPGQFALDQDGNRLTGPGSQFPAKLTAYDKDDERLQMKLNAPPELGFKMLEDKDIAHLQRIADQMTFAEFEQFAEQYFDLTNPAIARMVEQIMPEFYERRADQIDQDADLQKRIAKLRLYGVRSKDDMMLEFAIRSGKLPLPTGPIWDPAGAEDADPATEGAKYARGLFNPKRYTSAPLLGAMGQRWDPAGGAGVAGGRAFGQNAVPYRRGVFAGFGPMSNMNTLGALQQANAAPMGQLAAVGAAPGPGFLNGLANRIRN